MTVFLGMKDRAELYEKVIKEYHQIQMTNVKAEIYKAKVEAVRFSVFILTALGIIAFLLYSPPSGV